MPKQLNIAEEIKKIEDILKNKECKCKDNSWLTDKLCDRCIAGQKIDKIIDIINKEV